MYKRIELNRAWQKEAQELKIELPAVVVEYNEDTNVVMSYDSFVNEFVPKMEGKPKKKRRAARTSDATTTASDAPQANGVIDGKEEDNEEKAEG